MTKRGKTTTIRVNGRFESSYFPGGDLTDSVDGSISQDMQDTYYDESTGQSLYYNLSNEPQYEGHQPGRNGRYIAFEGVDLSDTLDYDFY